MSKSTYIFCCCILFISNQSFAVIWCSSDALESVLQCLSKGQFVQFTGWLELTRRISCSKIGLCKPKPWNIETLKQFLEAHTTEYFSIALGKPFLPKLLEKWIVLLLFSFFFTFSPYLSQLSIGTHH